MSRSSPGFPPRRILALALSALLVAALAYLRFAPDGDSVSVPPGAKAGELALAPCEYATEDGPYAADCGTLAVPENRGDPASRLIAVPVTRLRGKSDHPGEPLFYLEGGPGITNRFTEANRFAHDRDVVVVGYRGVDGSVRLDCPEVDAALVQSADLLGEDSFRAYADGFRACAARLTDEGVDLAGYGLPQQVEDLEAARVALGYDRIDLLSQSAGTRTAMIYAWRYPRSIRRSVMIGVNPPGHFLWDTPTMDEQIGRYADLCAQDSSCRRRTDDLAASIRRTAAEMPARWLFLPIKDSNVRIFSFYGLMESTSQGALNAPLTIDSWLSAAEGDPSGFWLQSLYGDTFPMPFVWGQYAAAGSLDAPAAREYFSSGRQRRGPAIDYAGTAFSWGGGRLADAWPAAAAQDSYRRVRTSQVETLLIGGELDTSTPPQVATKELLPYLPNGRQVVLPALGHTASFFAEQPRAGTRLINAFLGTGQVDTSLYQPQRVNFTPAPTLPTLAKRLVGAMVVLALLAVVTLLAMARRVRTRGRLGPASSAALRSLSPIVVGLGGCSFGALVVLATMPGVRLANALFAAISAGVPIGLGVYLAWVDRDWSAEARATGLAAAAAGAIVGGWLGFNATAGLWTLVTAIAGAGVGANLAVLGLDIAWDRAQHSRSAPVPIVLTGPTLAAGSVVPRPRRENGDRTGDRSGGGSTRQA